MDLNDFLSSPQSKQPHYLLIGGLVGHSVSPLMHNTAFEHYDIPARYYALSVKNSEVDRLIAHFNRFEFMGANITIPYKQTLFEAVDTLGMEAAQIGAINTIMRRDGKIVGENTDAWGFRFPIKEFEHELEGERAVIFGTGGATKAITFALLDMGMEEIVMVSRRPGQYEETSSDVKMCGYDNWTAYAGDAAIIINATPLGMTPNTDASPVREEETEVLQNKICYDIVYNPQETTFLKQAETAGGIPVGGLEMLIQQGAKSFEMWTGKEFPTEKVRLKLKDAFPN